MGSKKTKTTSTETTDTKSSNTPTNPVWSENLIRNNAGRVEGILEGGNPEQYVAPASALQQQGFAAAAGMGQGGPGSWQDLQGRAASSLDRAATSPANLMGSTALASGTAYNPVGYRVEDFAPSLTSARGYAPDQMETVGYDAGAVNLGGYDAGSVNLGGYAPRQMETVGYDAGSVNLGGYTAGKASADGYMASLLRGAGQGYAPETATARGYAPEAVAARGYTPEMAAARGYTAQSASARGYDAESATARGYDADLLERAAQLDPTRQAGVTRAEASGVMDKGLAAYLNPARAAVVDASLADFDEDAARTRAAQAASGARNRALGGSRFGVREALTEGELARGRVATSATLNAEAFDRATALAEADTSRRQQVGVVNAGEENTTARMNVEAENLRARTQAGFEQERITGNQSAINTARGFLADAENATSRFNTGEGNTARRFGAEAENRVGEYNATQATDALRFGAEADNRVGEFNATLGADAQRFGAEADNRAGEFNAAQTADARRFGAEADNRLSEYNATQRTEARRYGADTANRFTELDVGATNREREFGAGLGAEMARFNTGAATDAARFGAETGNRGQEINLDALLGARRFGAEAGNRAGEVNLGASNDASRFGAEVGNRGQEINLDALMGARRFGAEASNRGQEINLDALMGARRFGAEASNRGGEINLGASNDARRYGAEAGNRAGEFNATATGDARRFGATARNEAGRYGAESTNAARQYNAGLAADLSRTNAAALNDTRRFDAGQMDAGLARQLQAAGLYGDLASQSGAQGRADLSSILGAGEMQRGVEEDRRKALLNLMTWGGGQINGLPLDLFRGNSNIGSGTVRGSGTSKAPGGLAFDLLMAGVQGASQAGGAAAAGSDRRLKRDIKTEGRSPRGWRWVSWLWKGDPDDAPRSYGVVAQEVRRFVPRAVWSAPDGFLMVNYLLLGDA